MKKPLLAALAALVGLAAYQRVRQGRAEQDLWAQATDPVAAPPHRAG